MTFLALYLIYSLALHVALARAGHRTRVAPSAKEPGREFRSILIVGATGGTGRQLVLQALERGFQVTALARNPAKLQIQHARLTVLQGDVLEPQSLEVAMQGRDAVLCALGHKHYLGPRRILSRGTHNILRAMERQAVSRLVCETSLGIGDSAGRLGLYYTFLVIPLILPFYFWDKTRQERSIARSSMDWVIVRPVALTNGPGRGRFPAGRGAGSLFWTKRISRADVAGFMLDQLQPDATLGAAVGIG